MVDPHIWTILKKGSLIKMASILLTLRVVIIATKKTILSNTTFKNDAKDCSKEHIAIP